MSERRQKLAGVLVMGAGLVETVSGLTEANLLAILIGIIVFAVGAVFMLKKRGD